MLDRITGLLQRPDIRTPATGAVTDGNIVAWDGTTGRKLKDGGAVPVASGSGGATASGSITLTSSSGGAQSITPTAYGQFVKLPDATTMSKAANCFNIQNAGNYPVRIQDNAGNTKGFLYPDDCSMIGLADNSTAAGVWTITNIEPLAITALFESTSLYNLHIIKYTYIDNDRTLLTFGYGSDNLYGVVYKASTTSFGSPTLIRSSAANHATLLIATDKVLVGSIDTTTGFQGVILSLSGTTITVNTAATATNSSNVVAGSVFSIVAIGTSYVILYNVAAPNSVLRAMTVSGTTVTIGNETNLDGTNGAPYASIFAVSSSVLLATSCTTGSTFYAKPYTISGTTITGGTGASISGLTTFNGYKIQTISAGARWIAIYNNGTTWQATIISVSGTTATFSTVNIFTSVTGSWEPEQNLTGFLVDGSKAIIVEGNNGFVNIITDTAGTASAGTKITVSAISDRVSNGKAAGNTATFFCLNNSTRFMYLAIDYTGASPILLAQYQFPAALTTMPYQSIYFTATRTPGVFVGSKYVYSADKMIDTGARSPIGCGSEVVLKQLKYNDLDDTSQDGLRYNPTGTNQNAVLGNSSTESWRYVYNMAGGGLIGAIARIESAT